MKKILVLALLVLAPVISTAQDIFEKYDKNCCDTKTW